MNTIFCLIGNELTPANETFLLQYDSPDTNIQLFDHIAPLYQSIGQLLQIYDSLIRKEDALPMLVTDIPSLKDVVDCLYLTLFSEVLLCPETVDMPYDIYEVLASVSIPQLSTFSILVNSLRSLKELYHSGLNYMQMANDVYPAADQIYAILACFPADLFECFSSWLLSYIDDGLIENAAFRILGYSFLLNYSNDVTYIEYIIDEIVQPNFNKDNRLFIYNQVKRFHLITPELQYTDKEQLLYQQILREWEADLANVLIPIPADKRDKDHILVLTIQYLSDTHAPTKTALERIYTLGKSMGKKVLCYNTKEQYTLRGFLPFYGAFKRHIIKEYDGSHEMPYKDFVFPFFQPNVEMPNEEVIRTLLHELHTAPPYEIIVIGDHSIIGDLCSHVIPTICIPLTFSTLPKKEHQYVVTSRYLTDAHKLALLEDGYRKDSIIESTFTFEMRPQTTTLTRDELQLPEDKFLLAVIGLRLDADVSPAFLTSMEKLFADNIHLVFAGYYEKYEELCEKNTSFKEHTSFIGYQNDVLALMEICDLYVNPPRVGGGYSIAEAFSKGIPGVTMNYGDVAATAGRDFIVNTLEEMNERILRFKNDKEYYQEMAQKALERCKLLFDGVASMKQILETAEARDIFF